jgi:thiamine kinase-like enzyme
VFGSDPPDFVRNHQPVYDWVVAFPRPEAVRDLLEEAAQRWHPGAIIHGDLRFDNCLITARGSNATITFVDWEQAGWGDPAWDVACLVQDYLTHGGMTTLQFPPDHRLLAALHQLLEGHAVATGDAGPEFVERVVRFTGAKLIHRALQLVSWQSATTTDADRHGALGLELLEHHDMAMTMLTPAR